MSNAMWMGVLVPVMLFIFYYSCFWVDKWAVKAGKRDRILIGALAYGTVAVGILAYLYWQGVDV